MEIRWLIELPSPHDKWKDRIGAAANYYNIERITWPVARRHWAGCRAARPPSEYRVVRQFTDEPGDVHFCISRLDTALQRGLEPALGLGLRRPSAKSKHHALSGTGHGDGKLDTIARISDLAKSDRHDQFIPVRKEDLLGGLIKQGDFAHPAECELFWRFARTLRTICHYEYSEVLDRLRDNYYYFSPEVAGHAAADRAKSE